MNLTSEPTCLGLSEISHAIVESLRSPLEDKIPDMMQDCGLTERLGLGQYRWNFIIAQLKNTCSHLGWIVDNGLCQRGSWKVPVLFYGKARILITFMTEGTFAQVRKRRDKEKHYLCGAAAFNHNAKAQYEQFELQLPGILPTDEKWIATSQEQLTQAVRKDVGDIAGHVLILFDTHSDRLLSVRAVQLTPALEISFEENWTNLIRDPYDAEQIVTPQSSDIDEDSHKEAHK